MAKKLLIGLFIILGLLVTAVIVVPIIFKDEIKQAIDDQLEASVNADVLYDIDNFNVSLFANFPNLTVSVTDLGVIGRDQFAGEVLFAMREFAAEVNIWKLAFSGETRVQGIYLDGPQIFIKILEDGTANYDIAIVDTVATSTEDTESTDFNIAIDRWEITNGHVIYDDATIPTYVEFQNLNHTGSGNFSLSIFDLVTSTSAHIASIRYDGSEYLNDRELRANMTISMDMDQMKFVFKENTMAINDFAIGFEGWVAMPAEDIDMDLRITSQDNTFKSLISLIPAIYLADFESLESSGNVRFEAAIKGTYNENEMPAYDIDLDVSEGMFHYPELPESISNVNIAMNVASPDGNIDNTSVDIANFHVDFGTEPFDGYLKIGNLSTYPIDMAVNTTLNLANVSKLFPVEGLSMAGKLTANFTAKGTYDSIAGTIPNIDIKIDLSSGNIAHTDLPSPVNNLNVQLNILNNTGVINDTKVAIPQFGFTLDGQPFSGNLLLDELDDVHWKTEFSGNLDFAKLFPLINGFYPMPGTKMAGNINAAVQSEGRLSAVESEQYGRLSTSGSVLFKDLTYSDSLMLPMGMSISSGSFSFSPEAMLVDRIKMEVGRSDFELNGKVQNYLNYIFQDEIIKGNLSLKSALVDVNEFMTSTEEVETVSEETEYEIIEVPGNIDFVFQATLNEIIYENFKLKDATGQITVKNGVLNLNGLKTSTLGGIIVFDGNYKTPKDSAPSFAMNLAVSDVQINETYAAFNTVQMLAPIAKDINGKVSTVFKLNGDLQADMMPVMQSLQGEGKLKVLGATLADSEVAQGLTNYLKGTNANGLSLADVAMYVKIENGKLAVQPFDLKINNVNTTIAGATGLDGSIDYNLKMAIPAGQLGRQMNAIAGNLTGSENTSDVINLNLGLQGTYDNPQFIVLSSDSKEVAKKAAVSQLTQLAGGDQQLADSLSNANVDELVEEQKKLAEAELKKQQDSLKKVAEAEAEKAKLKALEEANKQLKNLLTPKKKKN